MMVVTILWSLYGFSVSFSGNENTAVYGDLSWAAINKIGPETAPYETAPSVSLYTFSMYQLMFAIVTSAILSGSIAGKMKWGWFVAFTALWQTFVYYPLAHWIFYYKGWLAVYGAIDFAGGLVIHTSSGVSSLVLTLWLGARPPPPPGKRVAEKAKPHNVPFVILGAALLW